MNRYDSLKKLYSDIEVLESAGLYKAANVLHKKFVKEAQGTFGGIVTQDAKNFMMELDKAYNSGQPTLGVIQKAERAGLPPQELQALKNHANKIRTQANTDFNSQYPSSGYSTPQDSTGVQGKAYSDPDAAVTYLQTAFQGLGSGKTQPQATSGDTSNEMQAQNSMPAESPMYQQAINQIAKLLQSKNPMNRTIADKIYTDTIVKFKNEKRRKLFGEQYQRLVSTNFPGTSLNPGK